MTKPLFQYLRKAQAVIASWRLGHLLDIIIQVWCCFNMVTLAWCPTF